MMPLITLGPLRLSSYGVCLIIAVALWWGWSERRIRASMHREPDTLLLLMVLGAWVGGRIWYVVGSTAIVEQLTNWRALEFAWPGALLGALTILIVAQRYWQWSVIDVLTLIAVPTLCAQAIGAIGMFVAGIGLGRPWDGAIAVEMAGVLRHPVQLYEALVALVAVLVIALFQRTQRVHELTLFAGAVGVNWLLVEGFRAQSYMLPGGIHLAQLCGLVIVLIVSEYNARASVLLSATTAE